MIEKTEIWITCERPMTLINDIVTIYRSKGAPFQFKVINNGVFILALNKGVDFAKSFQWPNEIKMPLGKQWLRLLTPITCLRATHRQIKNSNPHFYEDKYFFSDSQWDLQAIKQNFKDKLHIAQELFEKNEVLC